MGQKRFFHRLLSAVVTALMLMAGGAWGAAVVPPVALVPLNQIAVPEPNNLYQFVKNKSAAIRLGKALFWDMQVGSDGMTACATCHFSAGVDKRTRNTLHPGSDGIFNVHGPNQNVLPADFPFHQRQAPVEFQSSPIVRDADDTVGSQGVRLKQFVSIVLGSRFDTGADIADPVFNVSGVNTRQVTGRNAPSVINAAFNFTNFWDGRASAFFNGVNPFGPLDTTAGVWFNVNGSLVKQPVSIEFASLASQATGPPLSDVEMSFRGRTFPQLGRKMLSLTPLGAQFVHPDDSELGALSRASLQPDNTIGGARGLDTSYSQMIKAAFQTNLWSSNQPTPDGSTQMEANFSLFWGLAIQLYEATLISDDTPFDRFLGGDVTALTDQQQEGFNIFFGVGRCDLCHGGSEQTNASFRSAAFINNASHALMEVMPVASGKQIIYDLGFNNTAVRRTNSDIGRGGDSPFLNLLTGNNTPLSFSAQAELQAKGQLPFAAPILPANVPASFPIANDGAFKVPGLRNIELTGPYMHNGGMATLDEVIDFYTRGGDFPAANKANLDINIAEIPAMQNDTVVHASMVAFLKSFTDDRVKNEEAPFDHPELFVPNGDSAGDTDLIYLPATGVLGLPPTVTLTPGFPSPQLAGTAITFTAAGQGGLGAYEYEFRRHDGSNWTLVQPYSSSSTWVWVTGGAAPGTYTVQVNVRNAGSTATSEGSKAISYQITVASASGATLTPDKPSPQPASVAGGVTFTATGSGGSGSYEYEFWLHNGTSWSKVRSYSSNSAWNWDTTAATVGVLHTVQVNVRSAGTSVEKDSSVRINYQLTSPAAGAATGVTLTASPAVSQSAGGTVTFNAAGQGSTAYEYEFYLWNGAAWAVTQNYSPAGSWIMPANTPIGNYTVQVNVRGAGTNVESDASTRIVNYRITAPPATGATMTANPASPQASGNTATFTAAGQGSTGYEFQFWLFSGSSWALVQDYSTIDNWVMPAATPAGSYTVQVNVRSIGSSLEKDALARVNYQIAP